jgi:hypothetical protein
MERGERAGMADHLCGGAVDNALQPRAGSGEDNLRRGVDPPTRQRVVMARVVIDTMLVVIATTR